MKHEFRLADIGEGLEEAEIITWLVAVGDVVARDQPLVEIMTDKSNAELPAPASGVVLELAGSVGDILTVGELIAVIQADTSPSPSPGLEPSSPAETFVAPAADQSPQAVTPAASEASAQPSAPRPKASPSTRRAAAERGVDLTTITGTGPGGRILLGDLDQPSTPAAPAPVAATPITPTPVTAPQGLTPITPPVAPAPLVPRVPLSHVESAEPELTPAAGVTPLRGIRRVVARNMAQSWSEIPHIHAFDHIDAEPMLDLRSQLRATERPAYENLTPLSFFVAAVAQTLRANTQANASLDMENETITSHANVNVGIAVASSAGLVVPVLRGADQLDFETLSLTLSQLIRGAREGTLSREHFLGGTVTITNFGALGGEQAVPIIRPPESLILGFGSIKPRPFVRDGEVVACKTMNIVAGADHRLLDGDITTAVLSSIGELLTSPLQLVL